MARREGAKPRDHPGVPGSGRGLTSELDVYRLLAAALMLVLWPVPVLGEIIGTASVTDGDTIKIHGERIRLHGIDAPESRQICNVADEPWMCGKDAANALADWIGQRPVTCEELDRDQYDRIVARCSVAGEDLGEWLVSNGWAVACYRYSHEGRFKATGSDPSI